MEDQIQNSEHSENIYVRAKALRLAQNQWSKSNASHATSLLSPRNRLVVNAKTRNELGWVPRTIARNISSSWRATPYVKLATRKSTWISIISWYLEFLN